MRVCECGAEPRLVRHGRRLSEIGGVEARCPECGLTTGICGSCEAAEDHWERGDVARFKEWLEEMADER